MNNLSNMYVPIIMGSDKDLGYVSKISDELKRFDIRSEYRICSAHKSGVNLLKMLEKYEDDDRVLCLVTVAGRSNALSAFIDGHFTKPVIANPPLNNGNIHNLHSSTSMPSGVSPMVILGTSNCALAVLKLFGMVDVRFRNLVREYQVNNRNKLRILDVINRYNIDLNDERVVEYERKRGRIEENINKMYGRLRDGKVRTLYDVSEKTLLLSATDRLTGFDRQLCSIPFKGSVLNNISLWWFNKTQHIVPNHLDIQLNEKMYNQSTSFDNKYLNKDVYVKKCKPFLIEFVVRGYITGSSQTSLWTNYNKGMRNYCGINFPDGLVKNQKLRYNVVTPTTKGEVDELISSEEIIRREIMTEEEWNTCHNYALQLFNYGQKVANEKGLILVDTKYEFGVYNGQIILIDEIHTPDSSRYWLKHSYKERFNNGKEPESIDKEIIRKWVKKNYDPYDRNQNIVIPDEMKKLVMNRYIQLNEIITDNSF